MEMSGPDATGLQSLCPSLAPELTTVMMAGGEQMFVSEAQGIQWTLAYYWNVFILNCVPLLPQFLIVHVCYCSFKWPLDAATGVLVKWSATGSPLPCTLVGGDELWSESGLCLQLQAGEVSLPAWFCPDMTCTCCPPTGRVCEDAVQGPVCSCRRQVTGWL